jgi:hypothetical protein
MLGTGSNPVGAISSIAALTELNVLGHHGNRKRG